MTQLDALLTGTDKEQPNGALAARLGEGKPLRVKLGCDPTAPAVTLGWAVVLRKLRQFQEHGHTAVLIVGDFTAQVGDPSGKNETRRRLSAEEVRGYAEKLLEQFHRILLPEPLEVRYNSEWLATLNMAEILELTSKATVAQMLERGDFSKRYHSGVPISVMEFMYPLLQAYDSVAVRADVELGGSDQLWNLMMGRIIQERYQQQPQVAITVPLLIGTDGEQKMSQSLGNYIGIYETPQEMFGKTMSIPDSLMEQWFRLTTDLPSDEIDRLIAGVRDGLLHPGDTKRRLAREVVTVYHGEAAAAQAEAEFDLIFKEKEIPDDVPSFKLPELERVSLPSLIRDAGVVESAGEARRLIAQGAVRLDGEAVSEVEVERALLAGKTLAVGKRRFLKLLG